MERLWFTAKRYGYGWTPATWEGWLVLAGYALSLLLPITAFSWLAEDTVTDASVAMLYLPYAFILTSILLWICRRTGEAPRWRWGGK